VPEGLILLVSLGYVGLLFLIAYVAERFGETGRSLVNNPYTYTLSIAVYCTAWTFYGSVGRATVTGLGFLTIYLGPTLMAMLWWVFLRRIIRISQLYRITSIADFIASRYGKSMALGGIATFMAVVGITPYIALQLKAVADSFEVLVRFPDPLGSASAGGAVFFLQDKALWVAGLLAIFTILFGTRHIDATERLEGMVVAVAFESMMKLVAFLAAGIFVVYVLFDGPGPLFEAAAAVPEIRDLMLLSSLPSGYTSWLSLTVLSMLAIVFLPRQWQVTVVENVREDHLRTAAWLFPLYLLIINIFVLPIALAGMLLFSDGSVNPDSYVLALPLAQGNDWLALFIYLGGFSAATGMVIVATIALAIMVSNDLVVPALLRLRKFKLDSGPDLSRFIVNLRRVIICLLLLLAYGYYRIIADTYALVSIGLISFVAVAQFAPSILIGIFWKGANRRGAMAGLLAGFTLWVYTLLLPSFGDAGLVSDRFLRGGPGGIEWLHPYALFGLQGLDPITHSMFWSLLANIGLLVGLSLFTRQSTIERIQAALFVGVFQQAERDDRYWQGTATVGELRDLVGRFIGPERARSAFDDYARELRSNAGDATQAQPELVASAERLLAGSIGSASARVMISSVVKGEELSFEGVMEILDATSQAIEYSRRLEQKSAELQQASEDLRAANERLQELDHLKDEFVSMVSHELRTPLTSIRAFGEILLSNPDMEAEQRHEFLQIVVRESERLTRLINQVLDLSKIETGSADWTMEPVDLVKICSDAAASCHQLYADAAVALSVEMPEAGCPLTGDHDRLTQLVINLLSNAAKFTDRGTGEVRMRINHDRGQDILLSVADNGPGISLTEQQKIFDKFHQVSSQQAGKPKGSGLGLAICKLIMDAHGGSIDVESTPGAGATFICRFPATTASGADVNADASAASERTP
jgi:Na+/proline symporter/nitrogen-specific signal transduction histidine kinase